MKKKLNLKNLLSKNKELLFGIVIGLIMSSTAVFGLILYSSSNVFYKNTDSHLSATTLQAAIDELYTECTTRAYTLTADSKGGTIPATSGWSISGSTATKPVLFNGTYGTLPEPTKTGYSFVGWYTQESGGTEVTSSTKYKINSDSTIHAHWNKNSYSIGYTLNGGSNPNPKPTTGTYDTDVAIGTTTQIAKTVTVTGDDNGTGADIGEATSGVQTFAGWTSSSSAGLGSNAKTGTSANPTTAWTGSATTNKHFKNLRDTSGTVTLTATWTPVAFNLPTVTKAGYTCKWNTKANGTGTDYDSGASYTPSATGSTSVTMYAQCTGNTYTGTFYYQSNTTSGNTNVTSKTAQCTVTSGSSCSVTIPTEVTGSGGTYNNKYAGLSTSSGNMTQAVAGSATTVTLSANTSYYSLYRTTITIAYPTSTSAATTKTVYQNQWLSSNSDMATTVLSTSTTGTTTNATAGTLVDGYSLVGFNASVSNNTATWASLTNVMQSDSNRSATRTIYQIETKDATKTATFYYQSDTTSGNTTVSSKTATGTQTIILRCKSTTEAETNVSNNGSITIPTEVTGSGGTYNNKYVGVATTTGTMSSQTTANTGTLTYYAVYRTTITIAYPTSTSAATTKTTYQNQWFTSTSAMATTVLSTSTTGTTTNATAGALVDGYSLVGFNASASNNTATWANISALTQSDSNKSATRTVYQIEKKTATKTATFYYNNNIACEGTTIATTTADGTQTTFLRCTSASAAGTSVSNGSISVPSEVSGSKGPYNATYVNVASGTSSMSAATVNTGTLTYYAFYRSNVTRYYASSTTETSSDTLYRNEFFKSTSEITTVLSSTNTGTTNSADPKLAVSGYETLVGFNTSAGQNSANSGTTIVTLAKTCNTTVYEIDRKTETKTATFYYQGSATNETCSVTSTTATGTKTTFLRPTNTTEAGTSVSNGSITVPTAVSGSVGQYNNAYAGVASAVNSMSPATVNTGTLTYYAFYRTNVTIYRPSSTNECTTQQYYRNMTLSSTTACGTTYLSTSTTGLSNTTPTLVSGYAFRELTTEANGGTSYTLANAAKTNITTFYVKETKSVSITGTFYYNSNTTNGSTTISNTTASANGTNTLVCTSTSAASATQGNASITIPTAVRNSVGTYNNAYAGVSTGANMTAANSGTTVSTNAAKTYYAIYRTDVTVYRPSSESACTTQQYYRNQWFSSTTAMADPVLSTSTTGTSNTTPTLVSGYAFRELITDPSGGEIYTLTAAAKTNITTFYVEETKSVSATGTFYYNSNTTNGSTTISTATATTNETHLLVCLSTSTTGIVVDGSFTIPEVVRNSVGTYNNAYAGVSTITSDMTAENSGTTIYTTLEKKYYAIYRTNVTVYRPSSTSACTTQQYYRNQWFNNTTEMSDPVLSTSTTGKSDTTPTIVSGYSFSALTTEANGGGTSYTVENAAKTNTTTFYVKETKSVSITGTFYYNSNTTNGSTTISNTTASANGTNTLVCTSTSAASATQGNASITIPTAVRNSVGTYNNAYAGVSTGANMTAANSGTTVSTNAAKIYYAIYRTSVTNYYWNSSSYTSRTLYRNQWFSSTTAMADPVMSTSPTGTSNYSPETGPGSSDWDGLSTEADDNPEYTTVTQAAKTNSTTYYSVYLFNVEYSIGSNVLSIGSPSASCAIYSRTSGSTPVSCTVTLPSITPKSGYTSVGWGTSAGATTGTAAGSTYTLNSNPKTLYANAYPSVTYNAGATCTSATGMPATHANATGSVTIQSGEPTCSGKAFLGSSTTSDATSSSTWYDGGTAYSVSGGLTLYAQFYDVSSLENAYESFVQKGDLKKSALKTVNYRIMVDPGYETDLDMNTTCDSGYTRRIKIANFSTGAAAVRPFRINMNTTFGLRWLYTSSTSSDPYLADATTTSSLCSKDRPTTTSYPSDPIDTRIQRLKQLADVTIEYSEIKTKSDVKDNISLPSGTRYAEGASVSADDNYSIISHSAGFNIANASSSGTLTSRVYQYAASSTNGTSVTRIAKSYSSAAPKVKQTQYILEVRNNKKVESTFSPEAPKGLARYNALVTLNSNKSKYFPASYIKETLVKTGSESVGAWSGNSNVGKQISVSSGKLLGVSSFGVANDTNGEACSYAVINKSYVSGVNSASGSWYTYYYAGNKNYSDTAGHATTKTYGYAYIAYISSGSLSSS